jgi:hypothetical protein
VLFENVQIFLAAQDDACLGTAQELVTGEGNHIHTGFQRIGNRGFPADAELTEIHQTATSQVFDDGKTVPVSQFHQISKGRGFAETHDPVVAGMYLHQGLCVFVDGPLIIGKMGFIGGTHFL